MSSLLVPRNHPVSGTAIPLLINMFPPYHLRSALSIQEGTSGSLYSLSHTSSLYSHQAGTLGQTMYLRINSKTRQGVRTASSITKPPTSTYHRTMIRSPNIIHLDKSISISIPPDGISTSASNYQKTRLVSYQITPLSITLVTSSPC
jgi:hypothetical protein